MNEDKEKGKDKIKKLDITQKTTQKNRLIPKNRIIEIMRNNPEVIQAEMASLLDITIDGVKYQIKKMKKEGLIKRVGGDRGGHWEVQ